MKLAEKISALLALMQKCSERQSLQMRHGSQEEDKPKSKLIKTSKEEADEGQDGFV